MIRTLCVAMLVVAGTANPASSAVRFVKANAAGANNGTSWANAFMSLQSALAASVAGDEIWVAAGTYRPATPAIPNPRTVSFNLKSGVKVLGGFFGTETLANQRNPRLNVSVLSGDINGNDTPNFGNRSDNSFRVVAATNVDSGGIFDGFVIRGGNANAASPQNVGAGMKVSGGTPRILNCIIRDNEASRAAGLQAITSSAVLSQLVFTGNRSEDVSALDVQGAGNVVVTHCTIAGNTATVSGSHAVLFLNTTGGTVRGSILWGNSNPQGFTDQIKMTNAGTAAVNSSVVQNGTDAPGSGVVTTDPLLISILGPDGVAGSGDEDLRLRPGSPSIDTLSSAGLEFDYSDQDGDGNTTERVPFDTSWRARNADDPATPNPILHTIEHGAYEFQGTSCPGDIDGNGVVNTADLARFLAVFGDSGEPLRIGDFNADGLVNTADLVMFLSQFGVPCV